MKPLVINDEAAEELDEALTITKQSPRASGLALPRK
jgi:hypothetical protein